MKPHVKFSLKILPFVLGSFLIIMAMYVYKTYYPIMKDFQFITLQKHISSIEIEGDYKALSDCSFVGSHFVALDDKKMKQC